VTVVTNSCACLILHARLRAHQAPGIPCALQFQGGRLHNSGASRRGIAEVHPNVIARSQRVRPSAGPMTGSATKQSSLASLWCDGLLRGPVIGRAFARPVGLQRRMTVGCLKIESEIRSETSDQKRRWNQEERVVAGLDPATHPPWKRLFPRMIFAKTMDARVSLVEPAHDGRGISQGRVTERILERQPAPTLRPASCRRWSSVWRRQHRR
jgi:hypothetical protein